MTDYYVLDKLPANARRFWTDVAEDSRWTNSFDMFLHLGDMPWWAADSRCTEAPEEYEGFADIGYDREEYLTGFDLHGRATSGNHSSRAFCCAPSGTA